MAMVEACGTCRFVEPLVGANQCRRYPPQVLLTETDSLVTEFPEVADDWWCGEYKADPDMEE